MGVEDSLSRESENDASVRKGNVEDQCLWGKEWGMRIYGKQAHQKNKLDTEKLWLVIGINIYND